MDCRTPHSRQAEKALRSGLEDHILEADDAQGRSATFSAEGRRLRVKFLVDECLHTSLVAVAEARGHEARHVNWLGLSGETDWGLMPRILDEDFTSVTNMPAISESSTRARNFTQVCSSSFPSRP